MALRALQQDRAAVGVFTDAPEPLARVALGQLGASRRVEHLVTGKDALVRLLALLGAEAIVVRDREQLGQLRAERST